MSKLALILTVVEVVGRKCGVWSWKMFMLGWKDKIGVISFKVCRKDRSWESLLESCCSDEASTVGIRCRYMRWKVPVPVPGQGTVVGS